MTVDFCFKIGIYHIRQLSFYFYFLKDFDEKNRLNCIKSLLGMYLDIIFKFNLLSMILLDILVLIHLCIPEINQLSHNGSYSSDSYTPLSENCQIKQILLSLHRCINFHCYCSSSGLPCFSPELL